MCGWLRLSQRGAVPLTAGSQTVDRVARAQAAGCTMWSFRSERYPHRWYRWRGPLVTPIAQRRAGPHNAALITGANLCMLLSVIFRGRAHSPPPPSRHYCDITVSTPNTCHPPIPDSSSVTMRAVTPAALAVTPAPSPCLNRATCMHEGGGGGGGAVNGLGLPPLDPPLQCTPLPRLPLPNRPPPTAGLPLLASLPPSPPYGSPAPPWP